jgi:hypothetical protein
VSKQLESQFGEFQQKVSGLMETAAKNAPVGSDVAVAAVKSALEAANSAFGSMKDVVQQVTDITEANISKASSATVNATGKATKKK